MKKIPYALIERACSEIAVTAFLTSIIKTPNERRIMRMVKAIGMYPIATYILDKCTQNQHKNQVRRDLQKFKAWVDERTGITPEDCKDEIRDICEGLEEEREWVDKADLEYLITNEKIKVAKAMKDAHLKNTTIAKVLGWKMDDVERALREETNG